MVTPFFSDHSWEWPSRGHRVSRSWLRSVTRSCRIVSQPFKRCLTDVFWCLRSWGWSADSLSSAIRATHRVAFGRLVRCVASNVGGSLLLSRMIPGREGDLLCSLGLHRRRQKSCIFYWLPNLIDLDCLVKLCALNDVLHRSWTLSTIVLLEIIDDLLVPQLDI